MDFFLWFSIAMIVVCSIGMAWCFWALRCNYITHNQRQALIDAGYSREEIGRDWMNEFSRVTYHQHMRELMFLRDPYRLYSSEYAEAAKSGAKPYWDQPGGMFHKGTFSPLH